MQRKVLISLMTGLAVFSAAATAPAMAQAPAAADRLEQIAQQLQELKEQNERLQAEVEYLKSNALAARKDAANETVKVDTLVSTAGVAASKYTWSGDFRMRHDVADAEENVAGRTRDRLRLRLGLQAKVNDVINAKLQIASTNTGTDSGRSANQTLGSGWDRKPLSIDLAYVEWKASAATSLALGKQPISWSTTSSLFFDKDLTPEGAAFKYARGPWFANAAYTWLGERDSASSAAAASDATMVNAQLGFKQAIGGYTLTAALGYFNLDGVQDRVVAASSGCTIDSVFGSGAGAGNNAFGNTTYSGAAPNAGSATVCTRLQHEFELWNAFGQLDFTAGKYPVSLYVDYMKNVGVPGNVSNPQDTAISAGLLFNKASVARSWEFGYFYQRTEKDGIFAQFQDSEYSGGVTDNNGGMIRAAYVPLAGFTLSTQYYINSRFVDVRDSVPSRRYRRWLLDLNYKY